MTKTTKAINPVTEPDFESLLKGINLSYTSTVTDVYNYIEGLNNKARKTLIVAKVNGHDKRSTKTLQEKTDELRAMSTDWKTELINWIGRLRQLWLNGGQGTISGVTLFAYNCINNPMMKLEYPTIFNFKQYFYELYQNEKKSLSIDLFFSLFLNSIHKGVELALILPKLQQELQELEQKKAKPEKETAYTSLKEIIKPEFEDRLLGIENKIQNKVANWKANKNKIECAALVELLYDKKYIQRGRYNRKSCISFAQKRYGIDITIQMQSDKDISRNKHKKLLEKYFK